MKVIVDTNVFVSGVFWKGPPNRILDAWVDGRFKLIVSPQILEEYRRVLGELGSKYSNVKYERILDLVGLEAEVVSPVVFVRPVCKDADDDIFLEAGLAASINYIVSGDKALLATDGFKGLRVVTPSVFLKDLYGKHF